MLLETREDKLSARGVAFADVQFGLQVRGTFALCLRKLFCKQGYAVSFQSSCVVNLLKFVFDNFL